MTGFHVVADADGNLVRPAIRKLSFSDLGYALRHGLDDFREKPSHYVFLALIYPVAGVVLAAWTTGANVLSLLYPLMSGFALLGPVAAIGLYEISRRREAALDTSWRHAFEVRHSPAIPSIIWLAAMLFILFIAWLLVAQGLYVELFGRMPPGSVSEFAGNVFTTEAGRSLIIWGNGIGFLFAVVVLATTVVAFPLLLDRDVGAVAAIDTSVRLTLANPLVIAAWGAIVAALLIIGTIPFFAGLAVVMPILGHATWHLYRRGVAS